MPVAWMACGPLRETPRGVWISRYQRVSTPMDALSLPRRTPPWRLPG